MINRTLIETRLSLILELTNQLDSLAGLSQQEFLGDPRNVGAAESFMRRALEAVFDVGRHLLAKSGQGPPGPGRARTRMLPRAFQSGQ